MAGCPAFDGTPRNLETQQATAVAEELEAVLAEDARERQLAGLKQNQRAAVAEELESALNGADSATVVENLPPREVSKARDQAGAIMGVSGRNVSKAKAIHKAAPEVHERLKRPLRTAPAAGLRRPRGRAAVR